MLKPNSRFLEYLLILSLIAPMLTLNAQSGFIVEKIADGFQFVEGPVWKDGALLFSDIPANTIYKWTPGDTPKVFLKPSGNSNGLTLDREGRLLLAQHGSRQVARLEDNGSLTQLATSYTNKRLNSPNDLAVKSDGSVFFTDPPYGISSSQEELHYSGIFRIGINGNLQLLDNSLSRPNGIAFSPDEKKLYVSDSETRRLYVWDVIDDSLLTNKKQFAFMNSSGTADGMKVDAAGRIYASGPIGIWIYELDGTLLNTISIPGQTTNCCWGGEDGLTLFVTSGNAVYSIKNLITNVTIPTKEENSPKSFYLNSNYPNPFNPSTIIEYGLSKAGKVELKVVDLLGREIEILVNKVQTEGKYQVVFEAENLSAGVYICNLKVENSVLSKKMLLLN